MTSPYAPVSEKVRVGAGTAFKVGFFGALGACLCFVLVYAILGIVALLLFAAGSLPFLSRYFN